MSRPITKCLFGVLLLSACCLIAQGKLVVPTVNYANGPQGVGNPPKAGLLVTDIQWANCTGAAKLVTAVWEVPPGKAPLQLTSIGIVGIPTGQVQNQQFGPFTSNIKVQFVTEVQDANGVAIVQTPSGAVTVP